MISKKTFTKKEDKLLLFLSQKHKSHNWTAIATELGSGRTALQCFKRYQRSLNTSLLRSKWTEEEDALLIVSVKKYGDKNWQQVASVLEGRTGQQCLHRWQKTLNPNIARGRWNIDEDVRLAMAIKAHGSKSWVKVAHHVRGRTDVQCRERWCNILNPDLNCGPWTDEEDAKLREAVKVYGVGKWSDVAKVMFPRTDNQCWRRWRFHSPEEMEGYRQVIFKRRQALVSNFVGREKERPELTADDFEIKENGGKLSGKKRRRQEREGEDGEGQENEDEKENDKEGEDEEKDEEKEKEKEKEEEKEEETEKGKEKEKEKETDKEGEKEKVAEEQEREKAKRRRRKGKEKVDDEEEARPAKRGRGRPRGSRAKTTATTTTTRAKGPGRGAGRGRGRGRKKKGTEVEDEGLMDIETNTSTSTNNTKGDETGEK